MSEWQPLIAGVSWTSPPLFNLEVGRTEIVGRFGAPQLRDVDSNGVGLFDAWCIRFACGLEVALWSFTERQLPAGIEVHANEHERQHILFHLRLAGASISLWTPDTSVVGPKNWQVLRIDDNGNEFEVDRTTSRCEGTALVEQLEGLKHKQTYFCRCSTPLL